MGIPLGPKPIYLSFNGRLSEEALNNTHPQRASALLIQAIGSDNPVRCQKCTSNGGTGSDRLNWVFWDCRSYSEAQGGACGSCVWRQDAAGCSERKALTPYVTGLLLTMLIDMSNQAGSSSSSPSPPPPPSPSKHNRCTCAAGPADGDGLPPPQRTAKRQRRG